MDSCVFQQVLLTWHPSQIQGTAESLVIDENRWNGFFYSKNTYFQSFTKNVIYSCTCFLGISVDIDIGAIFTGSKGLQIWPTGQIHPLACFWMTCKLRIIFIFLSSWKKTQRTIIFCDMWKWYESHGLERSRVHPLRGRGRLRSTAARWVATAEMVRPVKPKIFCIWSFTEKVQQPLTLSIFDV